MSRVVLLGFGVEGQAAARNFLANGDHEVLAVDSAPRASAMTPFLAAPRFRLLDTLSPGQIYEGDLVLRSPGLPPAHEWLAAVPAQVPVTTPTGYWLSHLAPKGTITVTGTKGKSTTATLLADLLRRLGLPAAAMGNIGAPPLDSAPPEEHPVVEMSSYMLHDVPDTPHLHLITSLFREHTTWHGSEEAYRRAKLRPFRQAHPAPGLAPRALIDQERLPQTAAAVEDIAALDDGNLSVGPARLDLPALNPRFRSVGEQISMQFAVAAALRAHGPDPDHLLAAANATAREWAGLPSRMERVESKDGRMWINDALATVPEAVAAALTSLAGRKVTLILGGLDRDQVFAKLIDALAAHGQTQLVVTGPVGLRLAQDLAQHNITCEGPMGFSQGVLRAQRIAKPGEVILLSPAAATAPEDGNFAARADLFRAAARQAPSV